MPVFTLELWRAMEYVDDIGLSSYPIFDEAYREELNAKIVNHYHSREIGMETVRGFVFSLKRKMTEIMPMYNQLYESQRLVIDPLKTMDISTVTKGGSTLIAEGSNISENETKGKANSRAVSSTTPQVKLSGDKDYASSAADSNDSSEASGVTTENSNASNAEESNSDSRMSGYQGSQSAMLLAYRETFMNIDLMIIDELAELFMGVWDNGDDFLPYPYGELPNL